MCLYLQTFQIFKQQLQQKKHMAIAKEYIYKIISIKILLITLFYISFRSYDNSFPLSGAEVLWMMSQHSLAIQQTFIHYSYFQLPPLLDLTQIAPLALHFFG